MSVINQVLQDLDRRGVAVNVGEQTLASVPARPRRWPWLAAGLALATGLVLVWALRPPVSEPSPAPVVSAPVAASAPAQTTRKPAVAKTGTPPVSTVAPVKVPAASSVEKPKVAAAKSDIPISAPSPSQKIVAQTPAALPATLAPASGKRMNTQNQADAEYARAVMLVEQGREEEAQGALHAALKLDAGHREARSLLAHLLIQTRRSNEAESVLQEGLSLHPDASADAMLLARLRVERGDVATALETLHAGSPHAQQQADYRAFTGTLAQRLGKHDEAVAEYQAALRLAPDNAGWWVGLGISLQAAGHAAEAQAAYQRALALGTLTPAMQRFAEQRASAGQKQQGE